VAYIPLEIGVPSYESMHFDIRNFIFTLSSSTFLIDLFFLKEFLSRNRWFPMFKYNNWIPNTHHKFVFVLCNKALL
jgi:hypothetical protein